MVAISRFTKNEGKYLRNEFDFWKVHGIMNTSGIKVVPDSPAYVQKCFIF